MVDPFLRCGEPAYGLRGECDEVSVVESSWVSKVQVSKEIEAPPVASTGI